MKLSLVGFLVLVGLGYLYFLPPVYAAVGTVTINQSVSGSFTALDMTAQKLVDSANSAYFLDPAATGNSLVTAGDATVSGNIALGNTKTLRSAFGPLQLQYKSGLDAWTTGFTLQDTTGNVGIGTTAPTSLLHTSDSAAKTAAYTGVLHSVTNTSSTASVNKVGLDIESTGTWNGTSAVNTGLVVNATGGTTNYAATFSGGNVGIGTTGPGNLLEVRKDSTGLSNGTLANYGFAVTNTTSVGVGVGDFGTYKAVQSFGVTPLALNPAGNNVGIGTTSPGALLQIGTAGATTGSIRMTGSTSGYVDISSRAIGGSWTMSLPQGVGTAGYQLSTDGTSGNTSWTAAGSLRSMKNITGLFGDPNDALATIVGTNVYRFHYKPEMGTGDSTTEYVGVMADEAPWAMHFNGTVVNPVNTLGYMVLGVQALNEKITTLDSKIAAIETTTDVIKEQQDQINLLKTDNDELKARLSKVEMMVSAGSSR